MGSSYSRYNVLTRLLLVPWKEREKTLISRCDVYIVIHFWKDLSIPMIGEMDSEIGDNY